MSDTDFAAMIEPVARELMGEPNKVMSTKASLRWGSGGSFAVYLDGVGNWKDFETGEQGGVIDLVMRCQSCDKPAALSWLQEHGYIEAQDRATATQPRQDARDDDPGPDGPPFEEAAPASNAPKEEPVNVKRYPYTDGDRTVIYEVIRQQFKLPDGSWALGKNGNLKKSFWQRRPDGSGGWINSLGDVEHTIWRRPEVERAVEAGQTIYLCEGEKDVETIESFGLVGSTNSGGALNWKPEFARFFAGADVVILGDDDEAGRKRVDAVAMTLRGIAGRIRAIREWGGPKDVTDWVTAGGTNEQFAQIVQISPDWRPMRPVSIMGAVGVDQIHDPSLKHDFLIDGFLDRQGVAMMPGASGSGKTFLVLDMAMSVAMGQPFFGMDVKPGVVLYQAGEGKQGVTKRLDAWFRDHGHAADASIPFQMLTKRINLFNDDKDADLFIEEGRRWSAYYEMPIRLAVIDTFNKAITGANEISGQDMGKVLSRMERISVELDCAVLSPIHKSKEGGMRGHTSLKGDVSNVIEVNELNIRDQNGRIIRTVTLDKNKDGERGKPLRFVLRQVVLDMAEDGKAVTTCVIDKPDGDESELAAQGKLSLNQILVLKALRQAVEDNGEGAPNGIRAGSGVRKVVKYHHWEQRFAKTFAFSAPETEVEKRKSELQRVMGHAGKVLLAGDYIGRDNDLKIVWLTGKEDRPPRSEAKPAAKERPSPLMSSEDMAAPF